MSEQNSKSNCVSAAELAKSIDLSKEYTRQEVATMVGCIWANVLDASRGDNPKLKGSLKTIGKVQTWVFTGQQVLDWRKSVESRTGKGGLRVIIPLESAEELAELKKLLAKSKFANRF